MPKAIQRMWLEDFKSSRFIFCILILFSVCGFSQDYATIYVYRQKPKAMMSVSSGISFKIYVNKLEVAQIYNGGRLEYRYYKPGKVDIMCGIFSDYGGSDKYDNITLDVERGKSYYLKGDGKRLYLVSNEQGQREFENSADFKGSVNLNDDKPLDFSYSPTENREISIKPAAAAAADVAPQIVVTSPKLQENELKTTQNAIKLAGYVNSKSNIKSVKINGEAMPADEVGNFSMQLKLKEGMNRISIFAMNEKQQQAEKTFNIIRESVEEAIGSQVAVNKQEESGYRGSDPFKGTNVANATKEIKTGKYYALFVGIDAYSGTWKPLKNAVNDGKAIEALLKSQYKFDVIKTLYNGQATRSNIIDELEWLVANVKENDNVLIYYSGHGELKKELNKGFWVPVDAKTSSTSNYISNSDIQTFLAGIPSKHTLLVSDACFSGDIFRGTVTSLPYENSEVYYLKTYDRKSRQAISSGGLEPVMDGGREGHSVFAYYVIQALKSNNAKYFDASQLYNKIKIPVTNNSDQSPDFNPIKNTGDEGGNFIFIKK
jgi:hypothetical protein